MAKAKKHFPQLPVSELLRQLRDYDWGAADDTDLVAASYTSLICNYATGANLSERELQSITKKLAELDAADAIDQDEIRRRQSYMAERADKRARFTEAFDKAAERHAKNLAELKALGAS